MKVNENQIEGNEPPHATGLAHCAACDAVGYQDDRFCAACGTRMPGGRLRVRSTAECDVCGKTARHPVTFFCTRCGADIRAGVRATHEPGE